MGAQRRLAQLSQGGRNGAGSMKDAHKYNCPRCGKRMEFYFKNIHHEAMDDDRLYAVFGVYHPEYTKEQYENGTTCFSHIVDFEDVILPMGGSLPYPIFD